MNVVGYDYVFGLDFTLSYEAHFTTSESIEAVNVTRRAYFGFEAPRTYIVDLRADIGLESRLEYAIRGWRITDDEDIPTVEIKFETFVSRGHEFNSSGNEIFSSFFNEETAKLVLESSTSTVHSDHNAGTLQRWTLTVQEGSTCRIGEHEESVDIKLYSDIDSQLHSDMQEIVFKVKLWDDYRAECSNILSDLAMTADVSTGFSYGDFLDVSGRDVALMVDTNLFVRIEFDTVLLPHNITLSGITTLQDDKEVCTMDCVEKLHLTCPNCLADSLTAELTSGMYDLNVTFPLKYFEVLPGQTSAMHVEFLFSFTYSDEARTQGRRFLVATNFNAEDTDEAVGNDPDSVELSLSLGAPQAQIKALPFPEVTRRHPRAPSTPEPRIKEVVLAIAFSLGLLAVIFLVKKLIYGCKSGEYLTIELENDEI